MCSDCVLICWKSSAAYSGAALAFRDRLVIDWNRTQQRQTFADQKRIYCTNTSSTIRAEANLVPDLSLEFLMGRALDNAILNVGLKDVAKGWKLYIVSETPC